MVEKFCTQTPSSPARVHDLGYIKNVPIPIKGVSKRRTSRIELDGIQIHCMQSERDHLLWREYLKMLGYCKTQGHVQSQTWFLPLVYTV